MRRALSLLLLAGSTLVAFAAEPSALIQEGERASQEKHPKEALTAFLAAESLGAPDDALLVRISEMAAELVEETQPEAAGKAMVEKALAYAKRALAINSNNAKAHLCLAVGYGKLTDFVSNKQKLELSKTIRDEALLAVKLDPNEDGAWHVLGRWNFGVANVNPLLKSLAGLIYGGLPPASNEEALRCLKRAQTIAPRRIKHRSELARIYTRLGRNDLALAEWRMVLSLPSLDKSEDHDKAEARTVLR